jgi:hypothetical protein
VNSRLGEFLEHHFYPKKKERLSYGNHNIVVFRVEIKFELGVH